MHAVQSKGEEGMKRERVPSWLEGTVAEFSVYAMVLSEFATEMARTFRRKLEEGYCGWSDPALRFDPVSKRESGADNFVRQLEALVRRRNWIGVAVMASFLWNLEQPDGVGESNGNRSIQ